MFCSYFSNRQALLSGTELPASRAARTVSAALLVQPVFIFLLLVLCALLLT